MPVVHYAITRKVLPGAEAEFDARLTEFVHATIAAKGVTGVHILRPPPDTDCREYGVLRSFESEQAAEAFYASEAFQQWLRNVDGLVDGAPIQRRLSGLEAFFRSEKGWTPPRWKMAIVTYLGVVPAAMLWSSLLGPLLSDQHWSLRAAIINAAVVATLTWALMPFLTKLFHPWLKA